MKVKSHTDSLQCFASYTYAQCELASHCAPWLGSARMMQMKILQAQTEILRAARHQASAGDLILLAGALPQEHVDVWAGTLDAPPSASAFA